MVRNAQRRSNRGMVPKDVMKRAAQEVVDLRRGNRATAEKYGICHVTLHRFCKKISQGDLSPQYGYRSHTKVFTSAEEEALVDYLKRSADIYFGLPPSEVRKFAYAFAVSNDKEVPPAWKKNKSAGPDWFTGFMKRNPTISIRTPEATSLQRAMNFNRVNVGKFYDKLQEVMDKYSLPPHRIWNTDETGVTTVHKPNKVIGCKGKKQIGAITSAERGQLVTVCTAVSASGNSIPPIFIFPRARYYDHFVRDGPPGSIGRANKSGWMQAKEFFDFIKHFADHTKPSVDDQILLLLDNHDSHVYIPTIDFCRQNGIILLSFPPHTSHRLQPLDRGVYGPFKKHVATQMQAWMLNNPGKSMTIYDIPGVVNVALPLATTISNIRNGFKCSGIVPYNRDIFPESDYAPSDVTENRRHNLEHGSSLEAEEHVLSQNIESLAIHETECERRLNSSPNYLSQERRRIFAPNQSLGIQETQNHDPDHRSASLTEDFLSTEVMQEASGIRNEASDLEFGELIYTETSGTCDWKHLSRGQSSTLPLVNIETREQVNLSLNDRCEVTLEELSAACARWNETSEQPGSSWQNVALISLNPSPVVEERAPFRPVSVPSSSVNSSSYIAPEKIRPFPQASATITKRKGGRAKMHSAILTDSPERQNIIERKKKTEKRKSESVETKTKTKKRAPIGRKKKEPEYYCLVCNKPYSKSKVSWIQCTGCYMWAHVTCTADNPDYRCNGCDPAFVAEKQ